MKTCFFTLSHKTGILMADIIPYAGSHDTRLGHESSWPQVPSGTHVLQAAEGQGGFLRPERQSGVFVSWECEMSSFLAILMECGKIRDPYLSQPMRNACQTNVLSAAFSLIFRVPLWPAPATATKASARYAHIVLPTNGKRSLLCVIFPPPLSPASKILNLIWIAQFIAVCRRAKTCAIGENLLSVSDPISGPEEMLIHVGAL